MPMQAHGLHLILRLFTQSLWASSVPLVERYFLWALCISHDAGAGLLACVVQLAVKISFCTALKACRMKAYRRQHARTSRAHPLSSRSTLEAPCGCFLPHMHACTLLRPLCVHCFHATLGATSSSSCSSSSLQNSAGWALPFPSALPFSLGSSPAGPRFTARPIDRPHILHLRHCQVTSHRFQAQAKRPGFCGTQEP